MAQQTGGPQGPAQTPSDEPREFGDIREALAAVERMRQHAFVLGETALVPIPPMHRVAMVVVKLDVWWGDDGKPQGDDKPYNPGVGKPGPDEPAWALSNGSLEKLGSAAGIDWPRVKVTERCAEYVTVEATGVRTLLDGTEQTLSDHYTYDIEARAELARAKAEKFYDPKRAAGLTREQAGEAAYQKLKIEDRVHAMTKATSGAKSRVIERLLRMKRGGLRLTELRQYPFVFLKLVPAIDYENDHIARGMLIAKHSGLAKLAFGMGQQLGALAALGPAPVEAPAQLAAHEEPETSGPARTSAPPASEPARPPEPPRQGPPPTTARDELRRPPPAESDPWDRPTQKTAPKADLAWPTLAEFQALTTVGEQAATLAALLRAIGQEEAAARLDAAQVDPADFDGWYAKALRKVEGGR